MENREEILSWRCPISEPPPENTELLVKSPQDGSYNVTNYRPAYEIFTCQEKGDNMYGWEYFIIDDLNQNKAESYLNWDNDDITGSNMKDDE